MVFALDTYLNIPSFLVINIVLAFYMGNNLELVINDPIGQPMATVGSGFVSQ